MARSLPHTFCDELPIFASRATPAAVNTSASISSPCQASENHRKPRRWAEAKSVDNFGNDWNLIKDFHLSQLSFRPKRSQQSSSRTFPIPGNSQLLSNTAVVSLNNRSLPALPKEDDFRPRANSFEYNDESRFFSSNVIRPKQHPSPPPKKIESQRSLSKIVKSQTEGNIKKSFAAHPDSLVPGRSRRRTDVMEGVFRSSAFQQKLGLEDPQKQISHSSISSFTSPRTNNSSQKNFPFSKSYSHPMISRDKPWGNIMVKRPSTSEYNHVVTSLSDKPLPFVPSKDNYQHEEENENCPKDEHCRQDFFDFESSSKTSDHDHDEIGWKTSFLDSISEPNSNSTSIDINRTELSKPRLPNLSRISMFGTDIFSHLESENLHTNVRDIQNNPIVTSDLKLLPLIESNFDSDTYHVSNEAAGSKTLLSQIESGVDDANPLSSNTNSIGFVTSSGPHDMASEIKIQGLNNFSKVSSGDTLQNTEVDNNRNILEIEFTQSKDSIRGYRQDLVEKTKISTYDDANLTSTYPLVASDLEIEFKPREIEEISDKPGLISIRNPILSKNVPKQETISNKDNHNINPKLSHSHGILRLEKIQEPSELYDKSAFSPGQNSLDPNTAVVTSTMEKLENFYSVAQHTLTNINSDSLPFDLKVATINSAYENGRSRKFEPPDHEIVSEARKFENSEDSIHSGFGNKLKTDSMLESLSNYEDEMLQQQDIMKSINLYNDNRGDNFNQISELLNNAEDHTNTYLPSEYDNYWASTMKSKSERDSVAITSQPPIEKKPEALSLTLSKDDTPFVAPLSPRRQNDSALSRPQLSISIQNPLEDNSHFVSPISNSSLRSDFGFQIRDNTSVSPVSVASDSRTRFKVQSDLNFANKSFFTLENKNTSSELSSQSDFEGHAGSMTEKSEKSSGEIDERITKAENANNFQSFLLDQDLSDSAQSSENLLPKAALHDISLGQSCTNKDLRPILSVPIQCQSSFPTAPLSVGRLPSFRETSTIKSSQQKTQTFDDMREIFANFDIGLGIWIRELKKKHSEYENPTASLNSPGIYEPGTYILAREKMTSSNHIVHSPCTENFIDVNLSSLPHPSNSKFTLGSNVSNTQNIYSTNKLKSQQVQAKGKELFHTAGILSGKAGKAGKDLLAKGKNKLLSTGGDKID